MPGFKKHAQTGALVGVITNLALQYRDRELEAERPLLDRLIEVLGAAAFGLVGGILPDAFEPATSPNHRAFFHSKAVLGVGVLVAAKEAASPTPAARIMCAGYAGYISHLALDAVTKKGLPAIG